MTDNILTIALASAGIAKILVDVVRLGFPNRPTWVSPVLAILFGIISATILALSNGDALTVQTLAQNIIAGVLSGGSAIGITELSNRAQK